MDGVLPSAHIPQKRSQNISTSLSNLQPDSVQQGLSQVWAVETRGKLASLLGPPPYPAEMIMPIQKA